MNNNDNKNMIDQLMEAARSHFRQEQNFLIFQYILVSFWVLVSLIAWTYLLIAGTYGHFLTVELITHGAIFLGCFLWAGFVGYSTSFWRDMLVTFIVTLIVTIIAMYIGDVESFRPAQTAAGVAMHYIVEFIAYVFINAVMAPIPVFFNCGIIYVIELILEKMK